MRRMWAFSAVLWCAFAGCYARLCEDLVNESRDNRISIVGVSSDGKSVQLYVKKAFYDIFEDGDRIFVKKFHANKFHEGLVLEGKFEVNGDWVKNIIQHLVQREIPYDVYIDRKFVARKIGRKWIGVSEAMAKRLHIDPENLVASSEVSLEALASFDNSDDFSDGGLGLSTQGDENENVAEQISREGPFRRLINRTREIFRNHKKSFAAAAIIALLLLVGDNPCLCDGY